MARVPWKTLCSLSGRFECRLDGAPAPSLRASLQDFRRLSSSSRDKVAPSNSLPRLDWSFLRSSLGSLSEVFLEMMIPENKKASKKRKLSRPWIGFSWYSSLPSVEAAYRLTSREANTNLNRGRLVRGIIYDMSALIVPLTSARDPSAASRAASDEDQRSFEGTEYEAEKLKNAELAKRDWQSYLLGGGESAVKDGDATAAEAKVVTGGITLDELTDQMGLPSVTGRSDRRGDDGKSAGGPTRGATTKREREMEQLLAGARGDNIRAKYLGKLQEKQIMADARLSRGAAVALDARLSWAARQKKVLKDKKWLLMAGGAGILRHFQARLLNQSLLVTRPQADFQDFTDETENFDFSPVVQNASFMYSLDDVTSICHNWGMDPKEVIVVLGSGAPAEHLRQQLKGSGFFVCHLSQSGALRGHLVSPSPGVLAPPGTPVQSPREMPEGECSTAGLPQERTMPLEGTDVSRRPFRGDADEGQGQLEETLLWIMERLIPGFKYVQYKERSSLEDLHFDVPDMLDLKNVVEDLNGVSFRSSTFVRMKDR